MSDEIVWRELGEKLRRPFDPNDVDFRVQGRVSEQTGKGQVVAYIDARLVQDRLDAVVGPGEWTFEWEPIVVEKGDVQVAKGTLTIHGVAKSDVGTASNFEASKGCVSDALKRAAVHFGIGRYLYDIPASWVQADPKNGRISDEVLRGLRAKLPRPDGAQAQPQQRPFTANPPVIRPAVDEPAVSKAGVAPVPLDMAEAARLAATAAAKEPYRTATPTQWDTIRRGCAKLGREEPEPPMSFDEAGALIATLSEEYKRRDIERQKAGVTR